MGFLSSLFGFDDAKPAQSQVVQATKIPEELKPYVTEVMESAQKQFQERMAEGYVPYTGKTTADLTPEELQSMERITGLAGVVDPYIREGEDIYRTGAREFTAEEAQKRMSPYQQAVTDIALREAKERFEGEVMPRFEAQAIKEGGGPGGLGTRAGIEAAELQKGQAQLLADIQARGSEKAYQDAKTVFADQLARERQLAGDLGRTGATLFQSGLAEAGALEGVGETKRGLAQNLLDEALFRFKEERGFPQAELAKYSGTIYGNPMLGTPSRTTTTTGMPYQPSTGQNLLGLGLTGLNIYGMGGGFGAPTPGKFSLANIYSPQPVRRTASGGKVGGGLASLPVVRRKNGTLGDTEFDEQIIVQEPYSLPDYNPMIQSSKQMMQTPRNEIINKPEYRDVNINIARDREQKFTSLQKDLMQKSNAELDALDKAYFAGRAANIKDNPMARGAVIQRLIGVIAGSEKGALGGFLEGAPDALKGISDLDMKLAAKEAELEEDKYKTKREKITKRKQEAIDFIKEDRGLARLYDSLPAKAKERYLNEYKTIRTLEISEYDKQLKHRAALAKLKNDDRKYQLALAKYKNVDLKNIDIKKSQLIKDFRDLYYTDKDVAIAGLVQANIDQPKIDFIIDAVTKIGSGTAKKSVPNVQVQTNLPNVPRTGRSTLQATVSRIPNPVVSGP